MRRLIIPLVFSPLALCACEDGPNQVFNPARPGAGDVFNNSDAGASVDPSNGSFASAGGGGSNANELCSGEKKHTTWANMVRQPITPFVVAGIDGRGLAPNSEKWPGVSIEEAEHINCQSDSQGDQFGDGTLVNSWGDNGEVWAKYNINNHKIEWFVLQTGYIGEIEDPKNPPGVHGFTSRDKKVRYRIQMGTQYQKDIGDGKGFQNFSIKWDDDDASIHQWALTATELADALFATFAPELPPETGTSCFDSGHCQRTKFPDVAAIRIHPIGMHIWVPSTVTDAIGSTPNRVDLRLPRVMPYTFGSTNLKIDAVGPVTTTNGLGPQKNETCKLTLGMKWQTTDKANSFTDTCVNVNHSEADQIYQNKILGNMQHDTERFFFFAAGVNTNITSQKLFGQASQFDVLKDEDKPGADDFVSSVIVDSRTLGAIENDLDPTGATRDFHGSGEVYREYARLVQTEINRLNKASGVPEHNFGDADCLLALGGAPNAKSAGCSGFEGFVTAAPARVDGALNYADGLNLNAISYGTKAAGKMGGGLKPGRISGSWCTNGLHGCTGGTLWDQSFQVVRQVLGNGLLQTMPAEVQDRRFFFRMYAIALMEYLKAEGIRQGSGGALPDLANDPRVRLDLKNMFHDAEGAGQYERAEYVERSTADATHFPLDLEIQADILNGTFYSYEFDRGFYRPEVAMYKIITETTGDPIGKENSVVLTNLFGSPVLAAAFADSKVDVPANTTLPDGTVTTAVLKGYVTTAYQCATATWTTQKQLDTWTLLCGGAGNVSPRDPDYHGTSPDSMPLFENGVPMLQPYKGAIGGASTVFTLGSTSIKVKDPNLGFQTIHVSIPDFVDPYDQTSQVEPVVEVLAPWTPQYSTNTSVNGITHEAGFNVPLSGTRDKFVPTSQIDFSGTTTTFNIDYNPLPDDKGQPMSDGTINILAVETQDFLGDVFLCQDPNSGDILKAHMYSSVAAILDWINDHPGVYDACGLIVRYSPFNNFPDFIFSQTNGVSLAVTQGSGFGRVVDATLYSPGQ
jgi:hypothetical protein